MADFYSKIGVERMKTSKKFEWWSTQIVSSENIETRRFTAKRRSLTDVAKLDLRYYNWKTTWDRAVFTEIKRFPDVEEIKKKQRKVREKRNSKHVLTNGNGRLTHNVQSILKATDVISNLH